jgi:UDP-glucuronate decarboxylase
MNSSKRILVTGGAGHLGTHLCMRLLKEGHTVICLDGMVTGREDNLALLMESPRFQLHRGDVRERFHFEVDQIFNLACPASPVHYRVDPVHTLHTNIFGAIHVLDLAQQQHARVLQASTSEVYGDPAVHPQTEDYWGNVNPIGPRACYDESKRVAETLFWEYHQTRGVDTVIARVFNTYGPNMAVNDGRVISNFIVRALRGEPLELYGGGERTRSFCYVSDMIEGLVRLMNAEGESGPINLGNPGEIKMQDLAEKVIRKTGSRSKLVLGAPVTDDPSRRCPDISRAKQRLGWQPHVDLDTGLDRTIAWFRGRI